MEIVKYFERLGFHAAGDRAASRGSEFFVINNPDGTIRWLWPVALKKPLFLKFFHLGNRRAIVRAWIVRELFTLGLHQWIFKRIRVNLDPNAISIIPMSGEWALFTGTPGPNRKMIVYAREGDQASFFKIPLSENAANLLTNEITTLEWLQQAGITSFRFPLIKGYRLEAAETSDIGAGKRNSTFGIWHERALLELERKSANCSRIKSLDIWKETIQKLSVLKSRSDERIPNGIVRKLQYLIDKVNVNEEISTSLAHGDFTPWNMYHSGNKLSIYDWELSNPAMPLGFDAFHFVIQNGILVERKSWSDISVLIAALFKGGVFSKYSEAQKQLYLELYLSINITYYLAIYANQEKWHTQVSWLIQTWSDALTDMLRTRMAHRSLLAMDLFDVLHGKKYATLKSSKNQPEELADTSDIDICLTRKSYQSTVRPFFKNHQLVHKREITGKSFMVTERLIMQDGTMLCCDLIWKLKRKDLQFMMAEEVAGKAKTNSFGVSVASEIDDARYVAMFYALNGSKVPERLRGLSSALVSSGSGEDQLLHEYYYDQPEAAKNIRELTGRKKFNKGLAGVANKIEYFMDVVRDLFRKRGMVITFSGVDGAGKSTIIENVKLRIEKQLRRRVVVLRHRPSVLPILSAWTKGKQVAEQDAASRLPRQGGNKSKISSLLRFAYYYLDYCIGQFYVLVKYVWRGDVVLYDRYYFDFINDSRRSNIDLPPGLVKLGYRFILKPNFNFFLYASPELILSRKKELDENAIIMLTKSYLDLFRKLDRGAVRRYIPIENIELHDTLGTIFSHVNTHQLAR
jgi:thymidylate kinase